MGCEDKPKELLQPKIGLHEKELLDPLNYLNTQRVKSGMIGFTYNSTLELSASNHAKYEAYNKTQGHTEDENKRFFTGIHPYQRAFNAGYESKNISENISYNKPLIPAIDSLFTAIYHRFGFLDFDKNEVGFSYQKDGNYSSAVFVMGNSYLNGICKKAYGLNPKRYYASTCKDKSIKIGEKSFKKAINFANNNTIVYPYKNATNVDVFFSGEVPDPMPSCKITANPISVQFKPSQSKIVLKSFKLFENSKEIENTKIITKQSDINQRFTKEEFALFSLLPYKFNTTYKTVFEYEKNKKSHKISWNFTTKKPKNDYFVVKGGENLSIESDKKYDIFFFPKQCNDMVKKYKTSRPLHVNFNVTQKGINFLTIEVKGLKNDKISLTTNNNKNINFFVKTSSLSIKKSNPSYYLIGFLLALFSLGLMFYIAKSD